MAFNANKLPIKLVQHLKILALTSETDSWYNFRGSCGATEIYNLSSNRSKSKQIAHALIAITENATNYTTDWSALVIFTDIVGKKRYSYLKSIAKKSNIFINPKSGNKLQMYYLDLGIILKALKINPKDKKWK